MKPQELKMEGSVKKVFVGVTAESSSFEPICTLVELHTRDGSCYILVDRLGKEFYGPFSKFADAEREGMAFFKVTKFIDQNWNFGLKYKTNT